MDAQKYHFSVEDKSPGCKFRGLQIFDKIFRRKQLHCK
jgi:hypothetical protein